MARRGQSSSFPSEAGSQLPDRNPPLSYGVANSTKIIQNFGEKNIRYDPFPQVPITSPFYQQYAEAERFEPVIRIVTNVLERADGWWFVVAPASKQEYNQVVQVVRYPRRALPQVPEDVPPPMWKHTSEQFSSQMERYSGQFQMEGDFFMEGGRLADEQYENYAQSLLSGMIISLKLKITASVMLAKQGLWMKGIRRDTSKGMLDATEVEREGYCALSRRNKGLPIMVNYSKSLSRQQNNFDFNVLVLPYGALDKMATNNYYTEAFRVGAATALQVLATGGKKLAQLVDGMTIYEDAKWSIGGMGGNKIEQEPFLHWAMRGGWVYNRGNVECGGDDDPNCKYGIGYTCKGQKNICIKTLLDLTRESGRFASDGSIDPHTYSLAENWEYMSSICKIAVVQGRLDPMIYRLDNSLVNNDRTKQTFVVATKFGEVDIRYSPMTAIRNHVERMRHYIKTRLDSQDLQNITRLETIKKTLINTGLPTESQEALIAAVTIANNGETYNWKSSKTEGFFTVDFDNLSAFLKSDPYTKAPKELPSVRKLSDLNGAGGPLTGLPPAIRGNADKALVVIVDQEECVIMSVKYDEKAAAKFGNQRGDKGTVFGYVAVPLKSHLLNKAQWDAYKTDASAAWAFDTHFNSASGITSDAVVGKVGAFGNGDSSWVLPEFYTLDQVGTNVETELQWVLRPTSHVTAAINASVGSNGMQYDEIKGSVTAAGYTGFGQGFQYPTIVQAPDQPYYYGGINGLRYLAERAKNSDYRGWDENMMRECQSGIDSLDKMMQLIIGVYTLKNMYFDPNLVPHFLRTSDIELNRMNAAICGLFGEYYKPFLARRPMKTKPTAGFWLSPRTFTSWDTNANKSDGLIVSMATALQHDFGIATNGGAVAAAIASGIRRAQTTNPAVLPSVVNVIMFMSLLESGVMYTRVKEVILSKNRWDEFVAAYESSNASMTYADNLKNSSPYNALGPATNYRKFTTFYNNELKYLFDNAYTQISGVLLSSVIGTGNVNDSAIENAAKNLFALSNVLQWLILMHLDNPNMNMYSIDMETIKSKKAQGLDGGIAKIGLGKGLDDVNQMKLYLLHSINQAIATQKISNNASDSVGKQSSTQYWVNTGLCISSQAWHRLNDQLKSELDTIHHTLSQTGGIADPARVFELVRLYNTPIRPMMGLDYSKPIGGDPIKDSYFTQALVNNTSAKEVVKIVKGSIANMSQAMGNAKNSEWDMNTDKFNVERKTSPEPSYQKYAGYKTSTTEVEEYVSLLSGSRFEDESQRIQVPAEFLAKDPSIENNRASYLVNVAMDSADGTGTIQTQVEPQWLKYRMEKIGDEYKDELLGKMFAKLWCFSPIHFSVIENMINKKITPFGVGYVMLRPFQRDLVGAALFTVAGGEVAKSGWNCTIQSAQYNQQHNKVNVKFSSLLGSTVLQPDKIMWMVAQVMYGNYSGMGSSMYVEKDSFDHARSLQPEKDGFIIFVGDGLKLEDIPDCISITSQYNQQRYGPVLPNRKILKTGEQHIPGLLWTVTRFRLNELTSTVWHARQSFFDEKFGPYTNTDCYLEDCWLWNEQTKSYSTAIRGQWHVSGLSPADSDFLNGTGVLGASETSLMNFKG